MRISRGERAQSDASLARREAPATRPRLETVEGALLLLLGKSVHALLQETLLRLGGLALLALLFDGVQAPAHDAKQFEM